MNMISEELNKRVVGVDAKKIKKMKAKEDMKKFRIKKTGEVFKAWSYTITWAGLDCGEIGCKYCPAKCTIDDLSRIDLKDFIEWGLIEEMKE